MIEGIFSDESPDQHWPGVEVDGLTVLDLGAGDFGRIGQLQHPSTVEYWLTGGAARVIAVDENQSDLDYLTQERVTPLAISLTTAEQIAALLSEYRPDLVKVDIEGAEILLTDVDPAALVIPTTYLIEAHNSELHDLLRDLLQGCGYTLHWVLRHAAQGHVSVFCAGRST